MVHVVFGCGIALPDETMVRIASVFGTTGGFGILSGYRLDDSRAIYTRIGVRDGVEAAVRGVSIIPRTILRCRAQRARWPWPIVDQAAWRMTPLRELREQFGIRVARP